MLGDARRLRTRRSYGYLVSWKDRLRVGRDDQTAHLAERLLAEPGNLAALRTGLGRPEATEDELAAWLVTGLASGSLALLRTEPRPPVLDEAEVTNLTDLVPDPVVDPTPDDVRTRFEVQLVDLHGNPLAGVSTRLLHDGSHSLTTDDDGVVRFEEGTSRSARLTIPTSSALHDALARAADDLSSAPILGEDDGVQIAHDRNDLIGPLPLVADQRVTISVQPRVALGRLVGMFFATDSDFPLPVAREAFVELRSLYDTFAPCQVLVAGHTDTSGQPDHNDALSLRRAEAVRAFLTDDAEAWAEHYERHDDAWGSAEDDHMFGVLPDLDTKPASQSRVRWFQETRGLTVDGDIGRQTRTQLIREYMARDGTSLPQGTVVEVHGFGEAFPLDAAGEQVDLDALDGQDDPMDRRVELFFFADSAGIRPAPGPKAYLQWRRRAHHTEQHLQDLERRISFIVRRKDDQTPLPGARIRIVFDGEQRFATADTDGRVTFEDLPKGTVDVEAFLVGNDDETPPTDPPPPVEPPSEDFPLAPDDDDFEPGDPPGEPAQPVEPEDGETPDGDD